jgi:hypothetical protein
MSINPNFKEFLEKNPDKGMVGMFWALYWRFNLVILGCYLIVVLSIMFWVGLFT